MAAFKPSSESETIVTSLVEQHVEAQEAVKCEITDAGASPCSLELLLSSIKHLCDVNISFRQFLVPFWDRSEYRLKEDLVLCAEEAKRTNIKIWIFWEPFSLIFSYCKVWFWNPSHELTSHILNFFFVFSFVLLSVSLSDLFFDSECFSPITWYIKGQFLLQLWTSWMLISENLQNVFQWEVLGHVSGRQVKFLFTPLWESKMLLACSQKGNWRIRKFV